MKKLIIGVIVLILFVIGYFILGFICSIGGSAMPIHAQEKTKTSLNPYGIDSVTMINVPGRMKSLGDEVFRETDRSLIKEELQLILRNNRREFFKRMSKEAADQTNKELGTPSKEELDLIVKDVEYLVQAQKELISKEIRKNKYKIQELQKQSLRKIKRQRWINTTKECLKWGLLIYIALKI